MLSSNGRLLILRGEYLGVGQRDGLSQIEDVGCGAAALLLYRGIDLLLAAGARWRRVLREAVLLGERLDDPAVVRPVRRQRDDVEFALGLGGQIGRAHV